MTSRQPEITPPGIAGHAAVTGDGGERGEGDAPEAALSPEPEPAAGAGLTAQDWLVRLLPVALLIVAGLAGLRGAVGTLRWDGPLHQDAVVVGVVLEVVIVTLFVILLVRHGRGSQEPAAVKLRGVLLLVLGAGGIGAAVLDAGGAAPERARPGTQAAADPAPHGDDPRSRSGRTRDPDRRRTSR